MELKQQVLKLLEENRGQSISGSRMAEHLFVTRSAIWKAVKSLQKDGYHITAVTNKGYCLLLENDILSAESIRPFLKGKATAFTLDLHHTVTSTNTLAKELASEGAPEGTIVIAQEQTQGRGRLGRSFYSPAATGIYLSIILRPKLNLEDSLRITTGTAVAVSRSIEEVSGLKAEIKWVNDIFVGGKKVCGILTEAATNFEIGNLEYAIIGIGINVSTEYFPEEIKKIAGSIFATKPRNIPIKSILLATLLNHMAEAMDSFTDPNYMVEYKNRSFLIGKEILVLKGKESLPAKVIDIDDKAHLIVEYPNQTREALSSGEVSVRPMQPST